MNVACMPIVITMLDITSAHVMMDFLGMVLEFWVALILMNVNRILVLQLNIVSIQWEALGFSILCHTEIRFVTLSYVFWGKIHVLMNPL